MKITETIDEEIRKTQPISYGHVRRMGENRIRKTAVQFKPTYRKKTGRPRTLFGGIREAIEKREEERKWSLILSRY